MFFTSKPELFQESGVIQSAISDHFMIYAIRNARPIKGGHKTVDYRSFKGFDNQSFVNELHQMPWSDIYKCDDVDAALKMWNTMLFDVVDSHMPKKSKRVKTSPAPWLSSEIKSKMLQR